MLLRGAELCVFLCLFECSLTLRRCAELRAFVCLDECSLMSVQLSCNDTKHAESSLHLIGHEAFHEGWYDWRIDCCIDWRIIGMSALPRGV